MYKHLAQSQSMANHCASPMRRMLGTIHVPPGTKTQLHSMLLAAIHSGHVAGLAAALVLCFSTLILFSFTQGEL